MKSLFLSFSHTYMNKSKTDLIAYHRLLVPRIVWLLLDHGAEVSQKNKLGLTALHVAAANGNSQAIQVRV